MGSQKPSNKQKRSGWPRAEPGHGGGLSHSPEQLQDLGLLLAAWSPIEPLSTLLLTSLIKDDGQVSCAILNKILSLRTRLEIIKDVADCADIADGTKEEVKHIVGEIKRISILRNKWVHGILIPQPDGTIIAIESMTTKDATTFSKFTREDLHSLIHDINSVRGRVQALIFDDGPVVIKVGKRSFGIHSFSSAGEL